MKKIITSGILSVVAVALFAGTVGAAGGESPWDRVWTAIQDLQNQIANIQLIPGPQGPEGPQGPAGTNGINGAPGATGPQGQQGPAGTSRFSGYAVVNSLAIDGGGFFGTLFAVCRPGDQLITGGFSGGGFGVEFIQSRPYFVSEGWYVDAVNRGPSSRTVTVYAWCNDLTP